MLWKKQEEVLNKWQKIEKALFSLLFGSVFHRWNLIAKSKGKDMGIVKEPYSSYFSSHHVPVVYFNDEHTKKYNIELSKKLIDSLGEKFKQKKK